MLLHGDMGGRSSGVEDRAMANLTLKETTWPTEGGDKWRARDTAGPSAPPRELARLILPRTLLPWQAQAQRQAVQPVPTTCKRGDELLSVELALQIPQAPATSGCNKGRAIPEACTAPKAAPPHARTGAQRAEPVH